MPGKKFTFRLDGVLQLRRHQTEQARQELTRLEKALRVQQERVEQARQRLDGLSEARPTSGGTLPLRQFEAFRFDARSALEAAVAEMERLQQATGTARNRLLEQRRAEESLQTLHDQQRDVFIREQEAADTAFLDEQALSSFYRKHQNP